MRVVSSKEYDKLAELEATAREEAKQASARSRALAILNERLKSDYDLVIGAMGVLEEKASRLEEDNRRLVGFCGRIREDLACLFPGGDLADRPVSAEEDHEKPVALNPKNLGEAHIVDYMLAVGRKPADIAALLEQEPRPASLDPSKPLGLTRKGC